VLTKVVYFNHGQGRGRPRETLINSLEADLR